MIPEKESNVRLSNHNTKETKKQSIAIIGIGCMFPEANGYRQFWQNLVDEKNSIKEIPPERWDIKKYYSPDRDEPNKSISKWCGLVDNIDMFDNRFFNISPREANNMDPQQRLLLEVTWQCIEDSGVELLNLQKKITSVFVGVMAIDYHQEASSGDVITDSYACLGNYKGILANRISYAFGLKGQSISIDAACASSLLSIHEAKRSLQTGESDYAIAAGVSLSFHPWKYISFSKARMLSPDGQCKTFDNDANGYVPGDGVGVLLLKRLDEAIADNNHIYGIIKGSAVNHGGNTLSITAPRVESQKDVILAAYEDAGINPDNVTYIEAHGTGTSLGDPIEVEALTQAFSKFTKHIQFCKIGSVKTNIGHLEAAAGAAGVIKVLMMMKYGKIPKTLNIKTLNPMIPFDQSPFIVARSLNDWQPRKKKLPLLAGVSSFGMGGVNSHVVIEEYIPESKIEKETEGKYSHLFILSAKSLHSLKGMINEWKDFTETEEFDKLNLRDICATLMTGRCVFPYRYGCHIKTKEELKMFLENSVLSTSKQTGQSCCVRVGRINLESSSQIKPLLNRNNIFKQHFNKTMQFLLSLDNAQNVIKEFDEDSWTDRSKAVYSFIVGYSFLSSGMELGFIPSLITFESTGIWVALTASGIVTLTDAIAFLSGYKKINDIKFYRPKITIYDPVSQKNFMPFLFDESYVKFLVDELSIQQTLLGQILAANRLSESAQKYINDFYMHTADLSSLTLVPNLIQDRDFSNLVDEIIQSQKKINITEDIKYQEQLLGESLIRCGFLNEEQLKTALIEQGNTDQLLGAILVRKGDCNFNQIMEASRHQHQETRLGLLLVRNKIITEAQLDDVLLEQEKSGRMIGSIVVEKNYCTQEDIDESLRKQEELRQHVDEVLRYYVEKARLLSKNQYTFKKYLEEWDQVLLKKGLDTSEMLNNDNLLTQNVESYRKEKLLLMVIIMSSLRKLNQKWGLTEQKLISDQRFYELLDLIVDDVMPKEALIDILMSEKPDYDAITQMLNDRQKNINLKNPYRYIHSQNKSLKEIINISEWIEKAVSADSSIITFDNTVYLDIGELKKLAPQKISVYIEISENLDETFKEGLLQLWLQGVDIEWGKTYPEGKYKLVPLPVYEFDRKSFWLPRKRSVKAPDILDQPIDKVYSLATNVDPGPEIEYLEQIDNQGLRYLRKFSLVDKIINDHVISGKPIIPGACMIDVGISALEKALNKKIYVLKNIIIERPAIVDKEVLVESEVLPGEKRFIVKTAFNRLCVGKYDYTDPMELPSIDIDYYTKGTSYDPGKLYKSLSLAGYDYGKQLQVIKNIWFKDDVFLFELNDKTPNKEQQISPINPRMLDGMFQTALSIDHLQGLSEGMHSLYVPYIIDNLGIIEKMPNKCFVLINSENIKKKNGDLLASIKSYDASGKAISYVNDMLFKKVSDDFLTKATMPSDINTIHKNEKGLFYYEPIFIEKFIEAAVYDIDLRLAIVFINDNCSLSQNFLTKAKTKYKKIIIIEDKNTFLLKEKNNFEINGKNQRDYDNLIHDILLDSGIQNIDIFFLWAFESLTIPVIDEQQFDSKIEKGVQRLFYLAKALIDAKLKQQIKIIIPTFESQVIIESDRAYGYVYGTLYGLSKTIMIENQRIKIKMVDFSYDNIGMRSEFLIDEIFSNDNSDFIGYRNKKRYEKILKQTEPSTSIEKTLKQGGIYLLIGGAGGIGLKVSKYIAQNVNAVIIIIGRSELNSQKKNNIFEIEKLGSEVLYLKADVSFSEEMEEAIQLIKARYGAINGIIHAGGVIEDKLILSKEWNSFQKVLSPKVKGTWILNRLTEHESLDFFVVFSSIVGVMGNIGQADYAGANSFLDAFIHFRRMNKYPGKSISINWTLWTDGGMGTDPFIIEAFSKKGGTIDKNIGIKAFETILNSNVSQCIVTGKKIEIESKQSIFGIDESEDESEENDIIIEIQTVLKGILSKIIEIAPDELDINTDLREFGLDSISLTDYSEKINNYFNIAINPTLFYEITDIKGISEFILKASNKVKTVSKTKSVPKPSEKNQAKIDKKIENLKSIGLEKELLKLLSEILGISQDDLDETTDLREFGLDSITLTEFTEKVNAAFGVELNVITLFEYPAIVDISGFLIMKFPDILSKFKKEKTIKDIPGKVETIQISKDKPIYEEKVQERFISDKEIFPQDRDIAIIGISGRFPGSDDVISFWESIFDKKDMVSIIPKDRWNWEEYFGDPQEEANKTNSKWGGFLNDIKSFDAAFFKISPREAELMDPQQRLFIEEAWHTIENAGYKPSSFSGTNTGVFVGVCNDDYSELILRKNIRLDAYTSTGLYFSIIPNRVSYILNIHGPSVAMDTACSSSLIAIHQAVYSILNGDCEMAIAGGVNVCCTPRRYISFSHAGMLSKDGRCKTFDKSANGYVRGEGVGVVLLKPLSKALNDGDYIYAVIKGSAVNHGGYSNSLTAPNPNAQAELIVNAYTKAKIDPTTVTYIEAHGTGTSLGDPIEVNGLKKAFNELYNRFGHEWPPAKSYCGIGSVKTNIGHLETAAGIAGIMKIVLSIKYGKLPASIHFKELNPYIQIKQSPFFVVSESSEWKPEINGKQLLRRGGVSSFGFGGANAHVILEEITVKRNIIESDEPVIVVLSAKNNERLKEYALSIASFLEKIKDGKFFEKKYSIFDIAYTLQKGRDEMEERLSFVANNMGDIIEVLNDFGNNKDNSSLFTGNVKHSKIKSDLLIGGKSGEQFLNIIIEEKEYSKIAQLWVYGITIDWDLLYRDFKPYRIPLPGYPFAKEKYWLPDGFPEIEQKHVVNESEKFSKIYFKHIWEKSDVKQIKQAISSFYGNILILDDSRDIKDSLKNDLVSSKPSNIILAIKGDSFKVNSELEYEINYKHADDFKQLCEELKKNSLVPDMIIHLFGKSDDFSDNQEDIDDALQKGVYSLFYLLKALINQKIDKSVKIKFFYKASITVPNPYFAAISSFAKTVSLENPKFTFSVIGVENSSDKINEFILNEIKEEEQFKEIIYDNIGKKWTKKLIEFEYIKSEQGLKIRDNGVYLITGGLGGLGFIFSKYLTNKAKVNLILCGRADLNKNKIDKIKELESCGSEVVYIKADIANEKEVSDLIVAIKSSFGRVNGIIHCAGINRDSFFIKKTFKEFSEVLISKVFGTIYIDKATCYEKLDFFALFSSFSSVFGNIGQSDYAFANSFLDNFALVRENLRKKNKRHGRTISINWPLWEQGGMQLSKHDKEIMLNNTGFKDIPTEIGLLAWEDILSFDIHECIIAYGIKKKIKEYINKQFVSESPKQIQSFVKKSKDINVLFKKTEKFLKKILSEELKIPAEKIDSDVSFEELGIDSILIKHFNVKMEKELGPLPKTLLFEYQNLKDLCDYIVKNHESELITLFAIEEDVIIEEIKDIIEQGIKLKPEEDKKEEHKKYVIDEDIAIIGVTGRYPASKNLDALWENLLFEKDCITEVPNERWDINKYYDPDIENSHKGKMYCKWGGFIEDAYKFDPLFFNISPVEAEVMDPQERIFLESVWNLFESAGYTRKKLAAINDKVGVFAGITTNLYQLVGAESWTDESMVIGKSYQWSIANRVSYIFNLKGPSMPVDTACSSSLTAVHLACESIKKGECKMAVVGGVNLYLHPAKYVEMCQMGMLSPTGRCKSFGDNSDGFVPGEGVGSILLKPLSDAIKDKDNIYAVIKGTSINHGGRTHGYTVPNPNAQAELILDALKNSNINPRTLSYIEAHGTGTSLGDPVEIKGLTKAFNEYTNDKQFCSIGSIKSNIGHLESAAGVAGITKIILQLKNKTLVSSIHSETLNPNIDFKNSHFYVQRELMEWKRPVVSIDGIEKEFPRRAAISSFGAGGSNAHVIIEEFDDSQQISSEEDNLPKVILLSAKNIDRLKEYASNIIKFIETKKNTVNFTLSEMAYTLQVAREGLEERIAVITSSLSDLNNKLSDFISGALYTEDIFTGNIKIDKSKADILLEGEEGQEFLNYIINNKKLAKLAKLWVSGIDIDWELLYKGRFIRIISLPSYPFEKNNYRIEKSSKSNDDDMLNLLDKLEKGEISPDEVEKLLTK
ncbi:MAG: SDR family NAD(P)-dependent oxidoreductase [Desulfobacterales bacterium]|nr:SDR family NAD(P)-dependent oxidoreductase [Desulfobacterales bacterium]